MKDRIYDESQLHVMFYSPELHLHVKRQLQLLFKELEGEYK